MDEGRIRELWKELYGPETDILGELLDLLAALKARFPESRTRPFKLGGLAYCAYGDAFGDGLDGVVAELPRLSELGVDILWLLPILESPGRDQGFDVSSYERIDARFGGDAALDRLIASARRLGIQILFDVAINHSSDRHPWFRAALASPDSPYRGYYHFAGKPGGYAGAPLIFPGLVDSNWSPAPEPEGAAPGAARSARGAAQGAAAPSAWYFHRFYPFQPDLNYANPRVAYEMIRALALWKARGVDGFRMDAAALLWKEEGSDCENRPQVHAILKLFRACLDYLVPGTLLAAEANLSAPAIMDYFGTGDECRAAFDFALMPRLYRALLRGDPSGLVRDQSPPPPSSCSWFSFLRCHDEVTLAQLPPEEAKELAAAYTTRPEASFRGGAAFSGRLFELMGRDPERTLLAFSILFSMPGTPLIYYGDEIAMLNDLDFYRAKSAETGFLDSRFLHRGPFDRARASSAASSPDSPEGRVLAGLRAMLALRAAEPDLAAAEPRLEAQGRVLVSARKRGARRLRIWSNLGSAPAGAQGLHLGPFGREWRIEG